MIKSSNICYPVNFEFRFIKQFTARLIKIYAEHHTYLYAVDTHNLHHLTKS